MVGIRVQMLGKSVAACALGLCLAAGGARAETKPVPAGTTPDAGKIVADAVFKGMLCAAEVQQLQGTWEVVLPKDARPDNPKARNRRVVIDGNYLVTLFKGKIDEVNVFRVDPTQAPPTIDLAENPHKDFELKGIYRLTGDRLEVCTPRAGSGKDRPAAFPTKADPQRVVVTLRRLPKGDEVQKVHEELEAARKEGLIPPGR